MRNIFRSAGFTEEKLIQMAENGIEKQWLIEGRENIRKIPRLSNLMVRDENNKDQFISGLYLNGIETVYEIEFEDGKIYSFTGNHKLMTKDKEWKRVDELTEDDEILSFPS